MLVNPRKSFPIADHDLQTFELFEAARSLRIRLDHAPERLDRSAWVAELAVLRGGHVPKERAFERSVVGRGRGGLAGLDVVGPVAERRRQSVDRSASRLVGWVGHERAAPGLICARPVTRPCLVELGHLAPGIGPLEIVLGVRSLVLEHPDQRAEVVAFAVDRLEDLNRSRTELFIGEPFGDRVERGYVRGVVGEHVLEGVERTRRLAELHFGEEAEPLTKLDRFGRVEGVIDLEFDVRREIDPALRDFEQRIEA